MIKKLTIGAAAMLPALALTTGSAGAALAPADAQVASTPDVVINEVGVGLSNAGPGGDISGSFIELRNTTEETVSLNGWSLSACDTTNFFTFMTFGSVSIDPGVSEFFLIADSTYSSSPGGPREDVLGNLAFLEQGDGGLELADTSGSTDNVKWGSPAPACFFFTDAGVIPDNDNSIQLNTAPPPTWCALPPTPKAVNGSC